jgi:hypothetical protein
MGRFLVAPRDVGHLIFRDQGERFGSEVRQFGAEGLLYGLPDQRFDVSFEYLRHDDTVARQSAKTNAIPLDARAGF